MVFIRALLAIEEHGPMKFYLDHLSSVKVWLGSGYFDMICDGADISPFLFHLHHYYTFFYCILIRLPLILAFPYLPFKILTIPHTKKIQIKAFMLCRKKINTNVILLIILNFISLK